MPLSPHWLESVVRPKSQGPREPRRCPGIGIKATIAKELVLAYPDYSKVFEIYTDASSKQLQAVITQENRPIAFFSQKLSAMQRKYSVIKIELLAMCVCFWPPVPKWGPVRHEIPISSPPLDDFPSIP